MFTSTTRLTSLQTIIKQEKNASRYNCVGLRNRLWFFLFVLSVAINCSFTIYFACYCVMMEGFTLLYLLGLIEAFSFCGLGWILTCTSVSEINSNQRIPSKRLLLNSKFLSLFFVDFARLHEFNYKRNVQLQTLSVFT